MTTRTTFLGLGAMGSALAAAALDAGRPSVVWNRTPGRARALGERGATVAETADKAITDDGVIVVCLFDHQSVRAVLDPFAADLAGRTVINLTTTTPNQARGLATWAAEHGITYLDGAIMAVPEMIGHPDAAVFYSGPEAAFEENRELFDLWGRSDYFGADPGMASLRDMAMLVGMYTMFAGFLHGAAMVGAAGVSAAEFARRQTPFLAAMTGQLAGLAATVDAEDYGGAGQQSLEFTEAALASLVTASLDQGVNVEVLRPVLDVVRRQIAAGYGGQGTARIFEELRKSR
ncbi:NAD(P)-dependent oxidoreductase [Frankia sp. CNm7]|uniref:NAD(P)-dependent oxidoreductase n=1 Tax=Frankia nepalensis TaxID=1836974 RepID=A0A937UT33_9ACTN|nr:NAD(P)-binding domain-containing protein [Frankia nepalensis]MBL7500166.1 NAD(P)-dependent oxidoreductase [Frankia nepalensis]MBL7512397.1 NAD(P)-dependent oxidoreductase [Frankia nepalensis]MBL7523930.1 NAD(P)-dependent oxidoreductase [Frankia nepalensis]MBL7632713.1 NAD(P)-dependent oxidoreductase [Frankia nepalensis]